MNCSFPYASAAEQEAPATVSGVVLFGTRPASDLKIGVDSNGRNQCISLYLNTIPPSSPLWLWKVPANSEKYIANKRKHMAEQITVIMGKKVSKEAKTFADKVTLYTEWEGMSEGPLDEAKSALQWLEHNPASKLYSFIHLFVAHRFRAGYEAAFREKKKELCLVLAAEYKKYLSLSRHSSNRLIACIAEDIEVQPYVYLPGFGRP